MKKKILKNLIAITTMLFLTLILVSCSSQSTFKEKLYEAEIEKGILLPASINTIDGEKWGYINDKAEFKIKPEYDGVGEFNKAEIAVAFNNIDKVQKYNSEKNVHILNKSGKQLFGPVKASKYIVMEQNIVIIEDGKSKFFNKDGVSFKEIDNEIINYNEGLLCFEEKVSNNSKYGFMDEEGNIVIPANYNYVEEFKGNRIKVSLRQGEKTEKYYIDNKGNKITNDLVPFQDDNTKKYGYKDASGKVIIEPQYNTAEDFEDGAAIVEVSNPNTAEMKRRIGLIDKNGKYIIEPVYTGIHRIGEGLYSVNKDAFLYHDSYVPNAIFNIKGEKLSDFSYYNVQNFNGEYASACDESTTFFIDKKGSIVSTMPRIKGIGIIKYNDGIITGDVDSKKSYYKDNAELIWSEDNSILLADGIRVERVTFRPNYSTCIEYPEIKNLTDKTVQDKVNEKLKTLSLGAFEDYKKYKSNDKDEVPFPEVWDKNFSVTKNGDLIIIGESGYLYTGGAHGMPSQQHIHFNYKTGEFYQLADLFKKGSNYADKLTSIVQQQIALKGTMKEENYAMYFEPKTVKVDAEQPFEINDEYLRVYYGPYDIAPYAAGFPEFRIPYGQIISIIDTEGSLWKSFDKKIKDSITLCSPEVYNEVEKKIDELIHSYENGLIEAINTSDFSKVEATLKNRGSLYSDQKNLVNSLSNQGIKEKFNSVEICAIDYNYDKKDYLVYVNEDIGIKYPNAEYANKKFSWCYTVKEENGEYKLSDIKKWDSK